MIPHTYTNPPAAGRFVALLAVCLAVMISAAKADPKVTFEWNASPETDVTNYVLHYGTSSGAYTKSLNAGNVTTATIPDLVAGFTYYFAVTAVNDADLESLPSNEISYTVPWPATLQFAYLPRSTEPVPPGTPIKCDLVERSADGRVTITLTAPEQTGVSVFASDDLRTWEILSSVANPTGRIQVKDLDSPSRRQRFYRFDQIEIEQVPD